LGKLILGKGKTYNSAKYNTKFPKNSFWWKYNIGMIDNHYPDPGIAVNMAGKHD
jgi:hypothetical protein